MSSPPAKPQSTMGTYAVPDPSPVQSSLDDPEFIDKYGLRGCEIRESEEGKGLGLFATRDILPGTILLSETPLLVSIETGAHVDPLETAFNALSPAEQASYRSLHAYRPPSRVLRDSLNRSILYTNGFQIGPGNNRTGVFLLASRINHSCVANTRYIWHDAITTKKIGENGEETEEVVREGRICFVNHYKLLEGEEVTIDYGHKPNALKKFYGFECDCGGCTDPGSEPASSTCSTSSGSDSETHNNTIETETRMHEMELDEEGSKRRWSLPRGM